MAEEEYKPYSEEEETEVKKTHKGGRILRFEPTDLRELLTSPMVVTSFKYLGCYDFCEQVQAVQHHPMLTRLFISKLQDNQVTLVGVTFTLSSAIILAAIGIPNVGEKWFKQGDLERHYYEPFIKPRHINEIKGYFPFSHILDIYAPMMKIIMKYFSCEGRFSRLYSYHIYLLMHFTRVKMLNIPYYMFWSIDKMPTLSRKGSMNIK